jgi:hypothetical protein
MYGQWIKKIKTVLGIILLADLLIGKCVQGPGNRVRSRVRRDMLGACEDEMRSLAKSDPPERT